jgi:transposase
MDIIIETKSVFKNSDKYTESVKQKVTNRFPDTREPYRNTVQDLVSKFRETGSVQDAPRFGGPSVLSRETLDDICE